MPRGEKSNCTDKQERQAEQDIEPRHHGLRFAKNPLN